MKKLLLILLLTSGCGPKDYCSSPEKAFKSHKYLITQRLKAPYSAKFPKFEQAKITSRACGFYTITSYVDSKNALGVMLRTHYKMRLLYSRQKGFYTIEFKEVK